MITRTLRAVAFSLFALATIGLSGCATPVSAGGGGCRLQPPHVSADVARPGGAMTVSVSAATCSPRFDDDRRLSIVWVDHADHRTTLATVRAYPSGAFEQEVRLPTTSAVGDGTVFISGVEVPCPGNASCTSYDAPVTVVDSRPDFAMSSRANRIAAEIAEPMQTALEHRPSFVGLAIVPDGVEVVLHTTARDAEVAAAQRAFDAARAAVPAADRATADRTHLHELFVQHDAASLERLTMRIAHDSAWQQQHHIELSTWGGDTATDSVHIDLRRYSDVAARLLLHRYGAAVTVSTKDTPFGEAD